MTYKVDEDSEPIYVAVKKIKLSQGRKRKIDTFQREVKAISAVDHPNYVKLYGVGAHKDIVYTVMEMCKDGVSGWDFTRENADIIKDGFPASYVLGFAMLAEAGHEMSKAGILHRDFTLANILAFEDPAIPYPVFKICDFGVSATEEDKHLLPRGKMRNYAPEGMESKHGYCPESDLYSFGLMIYEMAHNGYVWK